MARLNSNGGVNGAIYVEVNSEDQWEGAAPLKNAEETATERVFNFLKTRSDPLESSEETVIEENLADQRHSGGDDHPRS